MIIACGILPTMTFISAEQSAEDSQPRELYSIVVNDGVTIYRHTSATRDISYSGDVYTSIALERGEVAITMPGDEKDLIVTLPIDHAFVRRWTAQAVPPRKAELTVYRQNGGETEQIWNGPITSMNAESSVAKFRVPSRAGEWMLRLIPLFTAGRECSNVLYDTACTVSRTGSFGGLAFKVTTTVIYVNGRDVRVDLGDTDRNGSWAEGGELLHTATGDRMTITLQTDLNAGISAVADLRMQMQIVGLKVGDSVEIYAGCDHDMTSCRDKFDNRPNFRGFPSMPSQNPWAPAGYGPKGNV